MTLRVYETAALWFRAGLKPGEQERAVARSCANLQGPSKEVVECANLKTLKMHEELSASVFCEKALSHRCLCLTLKRKYRRIIKSDFDQVRSSETTSFSARCANTTPQMTCLRGAKECTKWLEGKVMLN